MKRHALIQGSVGRSTGSARFQRARLGILLTRRYPARCRTLQARSLRSPGLTALWLKFSALIVASCFARASDAITLETVLQRTLEKNPAIQEAKSGLEQAAGQRLVFRSVAWPDVELGVPAGVQGGHRAGESGTKGFGVGRGVLTQTLFNAGLPATAIECRCRGPIARGAPGVLLRDFQSIAGIHPTRTAAEAAGERDYSKNSFRSRAG